MTLGSVVLGPPAPAKEPVYNEFSPYLPGRKPPSKTVWRLTKDSLPPIRQLVLTNRKEGGLNIAYLVATSGGKVLWHMSNGKLPVDGIRAWAEIPKVDV